MKAPDAAALVAAGMLSVLVYPLVGLRWLAREQGAAETLPPLSERSEDQ